MHIRWVDRTIFNATSAGLGDFVVASAVTGYLTPAQSSAIDGEEYHYAAQILDGSGNITAWEVGTGAYTAGTTTLARTTIEFSSNSNNKVNFATAPQVMLTALAQDFELELDADTNFYVSTTGNDSNTGLSSGQAWLTLQHAVDFLSATELNGFTATINIADGTYAGCRMQVTNNTGFIKFISSSGIAANVIVEEIAINHRICFWIDAGVNVVIESLTMTGVGGALSGLYAIGSEVTIETPPNVTIQDIDFVSLNTPVTAIDGARVLLNGKMSVTGNAANVFFIRNAQLLLSTTGPITIVGTPAWSDCFARCDDQALIHNYDVSLSFVGAATGKRFSVSDGGVIQTLTNNLNYFPGNVAGDILAGGQYDIYGMRRDLVADENFYVNNVTGTDTPSNGTLAAPFATLQYAWNTLRGSLDLSEFAVTINLAASATPYTLQNSALFGTGGGWIGGKYVYILGAGVATTTLVDTMMGLDDVFSIGPTVFIDQVTLTNSTNTCYWHSAFGQVSFSDPSGTAGAVAFIDAVGNGIIFTELPGTQVTLVNYDVSASVSSPSFIHAQTGSNVILGGGAGTFTGTPNFSEANIVCRETALVARQFGTITGAATGKKFIVKSNGVIDTTDGGGPDINFFPGSIAGTTESGGIYVGLNNNPLYADQTNNITVGYTVTPANGGIIATAGTFTPDASLGNYQFYTNGGAHTFDVPAADCAIDVLVTNNSSAGAITFSGTYKGGSHGDALTTTTADSFFISVRRINAISNYIVKANQ